MQTKPQSESYLSPSGTIRTRLKDRFSEGAIAIAEKVSVTLQDNTPTQIVWKNRDYKITKVGLRHDYLEGKTLIHIFSCLSDDLFLKLKFNTKKLSWNLIEVSQM